MAYERREFSATAVSTTLASGISDTDVSATLTASTGWPDGSSGDFFFRISSEVIRADTRTAAVISITERGADGTTAVAHLAGETMEFIGTFTDLDEANYAVSQTVGKVTTAEDLLVAAGANSFKRLGKGTNGQLLGVNAGVVTWVTTDAQDIDFDTIPAENRYKEVTFSQSGNLSVASGAYRWYAVAPVTIVDVWASVNTAPTGAAIIVDVNHNGTTIFTTQGNRPQIAVSGFYDQSSTPDGDTTLTAGEYLTVDIDQVGSTITGANLVVGIRYYETW